MVISLEGIVSFYEESLNDVAWRVWEAALWKMLSRKVCFNFRIRFGMLSSKVGNLNVDEPEKEMGTA